MVCYAASLLEKNKKTIDALNVFPVPDGDTGTNMSLTMQMAAKEIQAAAVDTVGQAGSALSMGSLKGARGNSGVILSQIFRGFSKGIQDAQEMDPKTLAEAMDLGAQAAYKAVMKPKEGTILTVVRSMADAAKAAAGKHESEMCIRDRAKDPEERYQKAMDFANDLSYAMEHPQEHFVPLSDKPYVQKIKPKESKPKDPAKNIRRLFIALVSTCLLYTSRIQDAYSNQTGGGRKGSADD